MAQFKFRCPQCGETVEADESLCGEVAECPSCGKGIVVPRPAETAGGGVVLKRVRSSASATSAGGGEAAAPRMTQYQQMVQKELENRRKAKQHETVATAVKCLVAVLVLLAAAGIGLTMWNRKQTTIREEAERRRVAEAEEAERQRVAEKSARDMFHEYLAREEKRLKKIVEEAKINLERIDLDQRDLSDELERIAKEDARQAEIRRKRGQKRYHEAERVLLMLKSEALWKLCDKYCGEDLAAIKGKYEAEVNAAIALHREAREKLRKNKEKYFNAIRGIDEDVAKKEEAEASLCHGVG